MGVPAGIITVVWIVTEANCGCCTNCVNGTGCPCAPPSNTGVMKVVTGKSGTIALARLVNVGVMFIRTNRRSADTTPWIVMFTPSGNGVFVGEKTICPPNPITFTFVTKN